MNPLFVVVGADCAMTAAADRMHSRVRASLVLICSSLLLWGSRNLYRLNAGLLGIEEWAVSVAFPEVGEDDHAGYCRIGTPQRGEGVALDLHYCQEDYQVRRAEDDHGLDLGEE